MRPARAIVLALALASCGQDTRIAQQPTENGVAAPAPDTSAAPASDWPDAMSAVNLRRERAIDLTGDGAPETLRVTARGPRSDSLAIALTITGAAGDTLWHDAWSSLHYFKYDPLEGKAAGTVTRIVREHVDSLLADSRFTAAGLAPRLAQGGSAEEAQREAVRYHLAELDWRGQADLTPADEMPPDAYSRIDAARVAPARVDVVLSELRGRPSFWYHAGGEETYAIAWSEREHAFVRLYSCC